MPLDEQRKYRPQPPPHMSEVWKDRVDAILRHPKPAPLSAPFSPTEIRFLPGVPANDRPEIHTILKAIRSHDCGALGKHIGFPYRADALIHDRPNVTIKQCAEVDNTFTSFAPICPYLVNVMGFRADKCRATFVPATKDYAAEIFIECNPNKQQSPPLKGTQRGQLQLRLEKRADGWKLISQFVDGSGGEGCNMSAPPPPPPPTPSPPKARATAPAVKKQEHWTAMLLRQPKPAPPSTVASPSVIRFERNISAKVRRTIRQLLGFIRSHDCTNLSRKAAHPYGVGVNVIDGRLTTFSELCPYLISAMGSRATTCVARFDPSFDKRDSRILIRCSDESGIANPDDDEYGLSIVLRKAKGLWRIIAHETAG
jgi:hypothetical protein